MPSHRLLGPLVAALLLVPVAPALAGPVTVDLRVEGPSRTHLEQKVTVDVRTFKFSDSAQEYQCDGTGFLSSGTVPAATRGGALTQAAIIGGVEMVGTWDSTYGSPTITRIGGETIPPYSQESKYLVEYKNGAQSNFGACGDTIVNGDAVVFGYGDGSESVLRLTGPTVVKPGDPATLRVGNEADGQAVAGASVAGRATAADGTVATAPLTERGPQTFKASKTGTIRSNAVTVCVTDGADGFCGTAKPGQPAAPAALAPAATPDKVAAFAKIGSVTEGKRFAKGRGPRTLQGAVDADAAGLRDVRLRLSRTDAGRCSRYDGARERFVTTRRCGVKHARTFSVGDDARFDYALPSALPRGRYVLDVIVIDRAGNQTASYQRGRNRVVFFVA